MNYTDEQFDKLPKWAKSYIEVLEMRNRELQENIDALFQLPESNTRYDANYEHQYNLPDRARIEFLLPSGKLNVSIDEYGELEIRSSYKSISVFPRTSNCITVIVRKD